MSPQVKNIFKYLYIKNCLSQGLTIDDMKEQYRKELIKLKTLKEKDIKIKVTSLYKFYHTHFYKCSQTDSSKNLEIEQTEKLF